MSCAKEGKGDYVNDSSMMAANGHYTSAKRKKKELGADNIKDAYKWKVFYLRQLRRLCTGIVPRLVLSRFVDNG